jgi:sporulation protein YlmC with PRC-barrel domain
MAKRYPIIRFENIDSIGNNVVTVKHKSHAERLNNVTPQLYRLVTRSHRLVGAKVISKQGQELGLVDSYSIGEEGKIESIRIIGSKINSLFKGTAELPGESIITIGSGTVVVNTDLVPSLEFPDSELAQTLNEAKKK